MKKYILLILLGFCINSLSAQYTLIPDPEFEQRLITQGIDTEGTLDGQVLTDDIDHITLLVLDGNPPVTPYIYDLTGIEDFISLEDLRFSNNKVEQVDLSNLSMGEFSSLGSLTYINDLQNYFIEGFVDANGDGDLDIVISEYDQSSDDYRIIIYDHVNEAIVQTFVSTVYDVEFGETMSFTTVSLKDFYEILN